jgi:malonyl-CoA/methylmalonyl-CoA synthetase
LAAIRDLIQSLVDVDPDRHFLAADDGRRWSYGTFTASVSQFAGALQALGVMPGDRVAAQVEKSPEALILYFGCLWIGAIFMPLNTGYTDAELAYFMADAEPALLVIEEGGRAPAGTLVTTLVHLAANSPFDGTTRHAAQPSEIAAMCYTSGTTGRPKGAMISRHALAANAATLVEAWRFNADDVLIHALPIYHVHGLFVATNTVILAGASILFRSRFEAADVISLMDHATVFMGVPTFYTRLLQTPTLTPEQCAAMRLFVSGSAPLLAETHRVFQARTGHAILERYGMTETLMNTSNPYDGVRVPGTVGPPLSGIDLRVTDPHTGATVPPGDIGMIEVKGANLFSGYWRNPEKTEADFRSDGYFITGDLGRIDGAGYVHIVGRGKDLIISGGLNIYPKEVEAEIDALPGVLESAVIGVPHPDFGEGVVAVVVASPTASLDVDAVTYALAERLARFKLPKAMIVVEMLPRNAMGKVQKNQLRDLYREQFSHLV